jgi:hypothetical protein
MTTNDLINYYVGLLIMQYSNLANALATVQAHVTTLIQNQIADQLRNCWDVTTAIGNQLNILAQYVGVTREAYGLVPGDYWALPSVNDTLPGGFFGWASIYDASAPVILWLQLNDEESLPYTLTDIQLRKLIQLKAALSSCSMGLADIDNILYSYFGTYVNLVDNATMSIIYQHNHLDPDPNKLWSVVVLENILPHQAGVSVSIVEV